MNNSQASEVFGITDGYLCTEKEGFELKGTFSSPVLKYLDVSIYECS
jgi:hypothetical protein